MPARQKAVKLGLYGCGNRTEMMLDVLAGEDEYKVLSAFDLREESAKTLCEKYGGKVCQSADEMLDTKGVDAVVISLDPFAHSQAFLKALRLGKPIFMEKPIAATARDAFQMMQAANAKKVPVHVGVAYRYTPAMKALKQHLELHDPGRIFSIAYRWHHAGETEMINMHNMFPGNFRLKISQIPFHCCHALDLICFLVGDIKSVYASGLKWIERDYVSPDEVIALFEFKNGAIGQFHYSSVAYGNDGLPACLHAENYTVTFSQWGVYDVYYRPPYKSMRGEIGKTDCRPTWDKNVGPAHHDFKMNGYLACTAEVMRDFLESVRTGSPMKAPIEDGYRIAEIADAIELSYKQNKKIELPLFGKHKAIGKNKK